jgi:hypothetical protein
MKVMKFAHFIWIALTIVVITNAAPATASDYHSPRSAALAGSGHAGPLLNDSIVLNPSFASFLPTYAVGVNYLSFAGPGGGGDAYRGRNYHVSIQDGRSELFQAGVAFSQREELSLLHFGASRALLRNWGIGLGGKYYRVNANRNASWDCNLSTTFVIANWIQTAFIADNLLTTKDGQARGMWREFTLGLKFNIQGILLIYADPHLAQKPNSGTEIGHEAGIEMTVFKDFFLRLGQMDNSLVPFEETRGNGYGVGVGWVAPRLSLDFGVSRIIEPRIATAYTLGGTVYF